MRGAILADGAEGSSRAELVVRWSCRAPSRGQSVARAACGASGAIIGDGQNFDWRCQIGACRRRGGRCRRQADTEAAAFGEESLLLVRKVLLLRAYNAARSAEAAPCDALLGSVSKVLDHVRGDIRARPAEACLAVHRNGSPLAFAELQEGLQDLVAGVSAVLVEQIGMADSVGDEYVAVVALVVEANDTGDAERLEQRHVLFWRERVHSLRNFPAVGERSRKSNELARDDPRNVSILQLGQILKGLDGKVLVVEMAEPDGLAHRSCTVQHRKWKRVHTESSVPKGNKRRLHSHEGGVGLLGSVPQHEYLAEIDAKASSSVHRSPKKASAKHSAAVPDHPCIQPPLTR